MCRLQSKRVLLFFVSLFAVIFICLNGLVTNLFLFGHPNIIRTNPVDIFYERVKLENQRFSTQTNKICVPLNLVGREDVKETYGDLINLQLKYKDKFIQGEYIPKNCTPLNRVAIILPYRDRRNHLVQFIYNVLPKLIRQNIHFAFFVIEQAPGTNFNRGMMRNIGYIEALKEKEKFDCFIFNDVDTIPEDDHNLFYCSHSKVRHLVSGVSRYAYHLLYETLFGGIVGFTSEQFKLVNGYSNYFFMWGGEDDDIFRRVINAQYYIERPNGKTGYITTLGHIHDPKLTSRLTILDYVNKNSKEDGINSLKYTVIKKENRPLFKWIFVDISEFEEETMKNLEVRNVSLEDSAKYKKISKQTLF